MSKALRTSIGPAILTLAVIATIGGLILGGKDFIINILATVLTASVALLLFSPIVAWLRPYETYSNRCEAWRQANVALRASSSMIREVVARTEAADVITIGTLEEVAAAFRATAVSLRQPSIGHPSPPDFDGTEAVTRFKTLLRLIETQQAAFSYKDVEMLLPGVVGTLDSVLATEEEVREADQAARTIWVSSGPRHANVRSYAGRVIERHLVDGGPGILVELSDCYRGLVANLYINWSNFLTGADALLVAATRASLPSPPSLRRNWLRADA